MAWQNLLYVGVGGFLGANARYVLTVVLNERLTRQLPIGTTFVNVTGSLLLSLFLVWAQRRVGIVPESAKLLIGTGFFGAYTTFSTYANESVLLWQDNWRTGIGYILITNLLCLLGVIMGIWFANRIWTT